MCISCTQAASLAPTTDLASREALSSSSKVVIAMQYSEAIVFLPYSIADGNSYWVRAR